MARAVAVTTALLLTAVLSGCSTIVLGEGSPLFPPVNDAPSGESVVVGATDNPVDDLARNALVDLEDYWSEQFPDVFGQEFTPLQGGYFSVDPGNIDPSQYPQGVGCGSDPAEVENNAFYCQSAQAPNADSISYDRAFLAGLAEGYGRFIPALVMAHEFGHAVQARVGSPPSSIATETQADCLAGGWTAWVAEGNAQHSQLREPELDDLLRGYLLLRDPVGTSTRQQSAHGSYFDRVAAFQEGFDDGPTACRDNFGPRRLFTQGEFTSDADVASRGNAPYDTVLGIVEDSLPTVWDRAFRDELGEDFAPPAIEPFRSQAPGCAPDRELDLVYCPDGALVGFDETDLTGPAYEDIGDFTVATAASLPYALAARDQLGLSTDDEDAARSAVCLTGWYAARVYNRQAGERTVISPGDVDESVQFLLTYGNSATVLPQANLTGFQLVDLFRNGFTEGLPACDVGA